jgi:LSD1 subclass zinc finger protein
LCWPDERHGQHAITQLPQQWADLGGILGRDAAGHGYDVGGTGVEASIPLVEGIDALRREIVYSLLTWEEAVRDVARLSDIPPARIRDTTTVRRSATILSGHYSALLALPPTDVYLYTSDGRDGLTAAQHTQYITALGGPDAVTYLAGLYHRADRVLGRVVAKEPRTAPCPPDRYGGCGLGSYPGPDGGTRTALEYVPGDTHVRCGNCGWAIHLDQYPGYAVAFIPPAYRPETVGAS